MKHLCKFALNEFLKKYKIALTAKSFMLIYLFYLFRTIIPQISDWFLICMYIVDIYLYIVQFYFQPTT